MKIVAYLLLISSVIHSMGPDCDHINKEVLAYRSLAPSGVSVFKDHLNECQVFRINGMPLNDYFTSEMDAQLSMVYIALNQQVVHPALLDYQIQKERWDLLLLTLDSLRNYSTLDQIRAINHLFYKDLPHYFNVEIKEIFNFFTPPEKITVSQQLIPANPKEIKFLNKRNNYIYEFWPMFDQLVFISHLKEIFPSQFERFEGFWREKLVSYYYEGVDKQDPSFKLLSKLLTKERMDQPIDGANESLQYYYYVKMNMFDKASAFIQQRDKRLYFNALRYFELFDSRQQHYMLSVPIQFSLTDIKRLFDTHYFQSDHPGFRQWVWLVAVENGFNCERYLDDPFRFLIDLPMDYYVHLRILAPILHKVNQDKNRIDQYFINDPTSQPFSFRPLNKKDISLLARFYNAYKKTPFKNQQNIISTILPFVSVDSFHEFLALMPYLTTEQTIDLIHRFNHLERIPLQHQSEWHRWVQSKLAAPPKKILSKD